MRGLTLALLLAHPALCFAKGRRGRAPENEVRPLLVVQTGHTLPVVAVALSRDGKLLATASRDGMAMIWDAATGHKLREIKAAPLGVTALSLSPDGRALLTGGAGMATLWDAETGSPRRSFGVPGEFLVAALLSPDGKSVYTAGDDGSVKSWDAATGKRLRTFPAAPARIAAAALSGDGRRLAYSAGGPDIWVWDVENGQLIQQLVSAEAWTSLAFSPDGKMLAGGGREEVRVWDVARGRDMVSFKGAAGRALAYSPDGRTLLTCGTNNTARTWGAASGLPERSLIGHTDAVDAVAVSADGRLAATGSEDHTARLWDLLSGRGVRVFGGAELPALWAAVSADGRRLLTVDPQKAALWDVANGHIVSRSSGDWEGAARFAATRDLRYLASVRDREELDLRDVALEKDPNAYAWSLLRARAVALDPAGRFAVTARDESLQAWDVPSAAPRALPAGMNARAGWLGLGLDGRRLVARGGDGAIELWDLEGQRRIAKFRLEGTGLPDLLISRDGRYLAAGVGSSKRYALSIRSLGDGEELKSWQADSSIEPYAFSPDGDSLLVLSNGSAWEWDLVTGRKKNSFPQLEGDVLEWPDAVDPAWRYLLARRQDGQGIALLSMATGKELGRLRLTDKGWIVFAADGRMDASAGAARWTEGFKSYPLAKFAGPSLSPGLLGKLMLGENP